MEQRQVFKPNTPQSFDLDGQSRLWVVYGASGKVVHGQDAGKVLLEHGAAALCDGMGGETNGGQDPHWPKLAATIGSQILAAAGTRIPAFETLDQVQPWADDLARHASGLIVQSNGGKTTGLLSAVTTIGGQPHLVSASWGDSRAVAYPAPEHGGHTREYAAMRAEQTPSENPLSWVAQGHAIARNLDPVCDYELNTDLGTPRTWLGQATPKDNGAEMTVVPLEPGKKIRVIQMTDGITGKLHNVEPGNTGESLRIAHSYLPRRVLEESLMYGRDLMQAAQSLVQASREHDDGSVIVTDYVIQAKK